MLAQTPRRPKSRNPGEPSRSRRPPAEPSSTGSPGFLDFGLRGGCPSSRLDHCLKVKLSNPKQRTPPRSQKLRKWFPRAQPFRTLSNTFKNTEKGPQRFQKPRTGSPTFSNPFKTFQEPLPGCKILQEPLPGSQIFLNPCETLQELLPGLKIKEKVSQILKKGFTTLQNLRKRRKRQ